MDNKDYLISNSDVFLIISHSIDNSIETKNLNEFFKSNGLKEKGEKVFLIGYKKSEEKKERNKREEELIKRIKELEKEVFDDIGQDINDIKEEKFVKYSKTSYTFDPIEYEKYQNRFYPSEYEDGGEEYVEVEDEKEEIKENNNINNINYKGNKYKYEKYDIDYNKLLEVEKQIENIIENKIFKKTQKIKDKEYSKYEVYLILTNTSDYILSMNEFLKIKHYIISY